LFLALTGKVRGEEYFLDIPEPNPGAAPALPLEKIFGVTSFELG